MTYNLVCGLETHVELSTKTKIFCSCPTDFGNEPNSNVCEGCIGEPGTLPIVNKQTFTYAIKAGLATNCTINHVVHFDRKNYTYPDLPKAYQLTQFSEPICVNGQITLDSGKKIRINRIHLEEDAGKLIHKGEYTFIDYNRGAVPLIEIVTEPDINSVEEAREYLEKLQRILRHIEISDCKMEEGSMRCDVNISVNKPGEKLGTRSEIKNMNSLSFIEKAIAYEYSRHVSALKNNEPLHQETRRFNESDGSTSAMREKENAQDYRYFEDPDIPTICFNNSFVETIRLTLPELPDAIKERYLEMGLSAQETELLVKYKKVADFYSNAAKTGDPKILSNYILGEIFRELDTEARKEVFDTKLSSAELAELSILQSTAKINAQTAKNTLNKMLQTGKSWRFFISDEDMLGIDEDTLKSLCENAVKENINAVNDYLSGKEKAIKAILGYVMKQSRGKADAIKAEQIILELIKRDK